MVSAPDNCALMHEVPDATGIFGLGVTVRPLNTS